MSMSNGAGSIAEQTEPAAAIAAAASSPPLDAAAAGEVVRLIPLELCRPSVYNPRQFPAKPTASLVELAMSIRRTGQVQPVDRLWREQILPVLLDRLMSHEDDAKHLANAKSTAALVGVDVALLQLQVIVDLPEPKGWAKLEAQESAAAAAAKTAGKKPAAPAAKKAKGAKRAAAAATPAKKKPSKKAVKPQREKKS